MVGLIYDRRGMQTSKLTSGRWILTVVTALVFAFLAISGQAEAQDVMTIVVMVFTLYFTRSDRKGDENV